MSPDFGSPLKWELLINQYFILRPDGDGDRGLDMRIVNRIIREHIDDVIITGKLTE